MVTSLCVLLSQLVAASAAGAPPTDSAAGEMTIESALVTLVDQADVPARAAGVLDKFEVREGQAVKTGEILARMDDSDTALASQRAAIEREIAKRQAENDIKVRVARKASEVAAVELKRAGESVEKFKKSVSETELDRLRLSAAHAELTIAQALHEQETAQLTEHLKATEQKLAELAVERRKIVSPIEGVVVALHAHAGEWVESGKPVIRVIRLNRLRVEAFAPARRLPGEVVGRPVTLTVDLPGRGSSEFSGVVVFVSPEVNPVNGQVRVWAEVDNPRLFLRPGLQGTLQIRAAAHQTAGKER